MKYKTFTLSEVLITLTIIGIIAAITVPLLMQNYKRQQYTAKLKKVINVINNSFNLAMVDNGLSRESIICDEQIGGANPSGDIFNTYLKDYLNVYKIYTSTEEMEKDNIFKLGNQNITSDMPLVILSDGTIIQWDGVAYGSGNECYTGFWVDINGAAKPNTSGKDILYFYMTTPTFTSSSKKLSNLPLITTSVGSYGKYSYKRCYDSCKQYNNSYICTRLLELSGWEYNKNYPKNL